LGPRYPKKPRIQCFKATSLLVGLLDPGETIMGLLDPRENVMGLQDLLEEIYNNVTGHLTDNVTRPNSLI
jgi:hypothetical protein